MIIYTSYYANLNRIADRLSATNDKRILVPISIAGKCIDWYSGLEYKKLAPKKTFFTTWKSLEGQVDEEVRMKYYVNHFNTEILNKLNPKEVYNELSKLSDNNDVILLCYEVSSKFCHRHLVREWFLANGYESYEITKDCNFHNTKKFNTSIKMEYDHNNEEYVFKYEKSVLK